MVSGRWAAMTALIEISYVLLLVNETASYDVGLKECEVIPFALLDTEMPKKLV